MNTHCEPNMISASSVVCSHWRGGGHREKEGGFYPGWVSAGG